MKIDKTELELFTLLTIDLSDSDGIAKPEDLDGVVFGEESPGALNFEKGVVISGRAPVWVFAALVHICHPAAWVGTHDPRLGGAVVVSRHTPDAPQVGSVVPV